MISNRIRNDVETSAKRMTANKGFKLKKQLKTKVFSSGTLCVLALVSVSLLIGNVESLETKIDYETEYIYNFTVPKNDPTNACLKLIASFFFEATYPIQVSSNSSVVNATVNFTLPHNNFTYDGLCLSDLNKFELKFLNDWRLELYFHKANNDSFIFNHIVLYYEFSGPLFPNSIHKGAQSEVYDRVFANGTLDTSVICISGYKIDLGEVSVTMRDVHLEPFFNKRPNLPFDKAVSCPHDNPLPILNNSSILIPILVMSVFLVAILFSCILYCCVKCRNKYEGVPVN